LDPTAVPQSNGSAAARTGRIQCLDGLRALAIGLVVSGHLAGQYRWRSPLTTLLPLTAAHLGVTVFFVVSGFLITTLLLRERTRTGGRISLLAFYRRRALRIFPAYLTFLAAIFLLTRLGLFEMPRRYWAGALTYTMSFLPLRGVFPVAHLWSLSVEEQFYVAWPCLLVVLGPRRSMYAVVGTLVATPAIRVLVAGSGLDIATSSFTQMSSIATGCLAAFVLSGDGFPRVAAAIRRAPDVTLAASLVVLELSHLLRREPAYLVRAYDPVNALACAAALLALVELPASSLAVRLLGLRPIVGVGVLSYGIYLWQQLVIWYGKGGTRLPPLAEIPILLAAAVVSYVVVESPFLRLKDRPAPGGG
jgi:peptidoglycan/LPS O-acetylase OafA/YrhL